MNEVQKSSATPMPRAANTVHFRKMLERNVPVALCPEINLIVAVIAQAWTDSCKLDKLWNPHLDAESARLFFTDGSADAMGEVIGISAGFIPDQFRKHHPVFGVAAVAAPRQAKVIGKVGARGSCPAQVGWL